MYETKGNRECSISCLGKSVRSAVPHLTSHIITQLHPFSLENLELFMLFHTRLHGIEAFSEQ